jgi:hypothetical protein
MPTSSFLLLRLMGIICQIIAVGVVILAIGAVGALWVQAWQAPRLERDTAPIISQMIVLLCGAGLIALPLAILGQLVALLLNMQGQLHELRQVVQAQRAAPTLRETGDALRANEVQAQIGARMNKLATDARDVPPKS